MISHIIGAPVPDHGNLAEASQVARLNAVLYHASCKYTSLLEVRSARLAVHIEGEPPLQAIGVISMSAGDNVCVWSAALTWFGKW